MLPFYFDILPLLLVTTGMTHTTDPSSPYKTQLRITGSKLRSSTAKRRKASSMMEMMDVVFFSINQANDHELDILSILS